MHDVIINTDIHKLISITVAYVVLAVLFLYFGIFVGSSYVIDIVCLVIFCCICLAIISNVKQMLHPETIFKADSSGVTDYSKKDDIVFLPWDHIERIDLKAANNESLMLDVIGFLGPDRLSQLTDEQREQLNANGGKAYCLLELSGMWVSRKRLEQAFDDISVLAARYNPHIACTGFQDPLLAKSKKGQQRLAHRKKAHDKAVEERLKKELENDESSKNG